MQVLVFLNAACKTVCQISGDLGVKALSDGLCRVAAKLWMCSCMNGEGGRAHQYVIFGSPGVDPSVTLALPSFDPLLFLARVNVTIIWVILWNLDQGWKWYSTQKLTMKLLWHDDAPFFLTFTFHAHSTVGLGRSEIHFEWNIKLFSISVNGKKKKKKHDLCWNYFQNNSQTLIASKWKLCQIINVWLFKDWRALTLKKKNCWAILKN